MKRKYIAVLLGLMLGMSSLVGCSGKSTAVTESDSKAAEEASEEESGKADDGIEADIYGEVSAVSDHTITIKVGTMKQRVPQGEREDESQDAETSDSEQEDAEASDSDQGDGKRAGWNQDREDFSMLELTGEEQEITLTDSTVITRMGMGGAMSADGEPPELPERGEAPENGEKPEMPDGEQMQADGEVPEMSTDGGKPELPEGEAPPEGETGSGNAGRGMGQRGQRETEEITISDISEGDTVAITLDADGNAAVIMVFGMSGGGPSGQPQGASDGADSYDAVNAYTSDTELEGDTISSTGTDEDAVNISGGASVKMTDVTVSRTSSDSTGGDNSSFYGVGAAILTVDGTAYISDSSVDTNAAGAAGIFAYGDGVVYASGTEIVTQKDTSGGIHAAGGGTFYAWDMDVETNGGSAAAIRSDRGGGKLVVDGGSYISNGVGSPAVYSTAQIAIHDAELTANGSEAICIEGLNEIRLFDSDLTGNMSDDERNDCTWNVILYQSMSGDSEVGNSTFEMNGGSLTARNGGMFYTTNTESTIILNDVDITSAADNEFFLRCTGNANQRGWGQSGANGADCHFTGIGQDMEGDVIWDSISSLDFYLTEGSMLEGAVLQDESFAGDGGDGYCSIYVGGDCTWTVTEDSVLSSLYCAGELQDAEGNTVTVKGSNGTVYAEGEGNITVTVDSYEESVDLSGASVSVSWVDYETEKPEM